MKTITSSSSAKTQTSLNQHSLIFLMCTLAHTYIGCLGEHRTGSVSLELRGGVDGLLVRHFCTALADEGALIHFHYILTYSRFFTILTRSM